MGAHRQAAPPRDRAPHDQKPWRSLDSYGIVLMLIVLDYLAVSALSQSEWGHLCIVVVLGITLLFTLRTSGAHLIWRLMALAYLMASTLLTLVEVALPGTISVSWQLSLIAGLLLFGTPFTIARRISSHRVVTTETVLGAICVYLLIGFSFAFIYSTIGSLSPAPFFTNHLSHPTMSEYIFFSYTTLTTVGYGDLVPAGNVGQTFAMLEALTGQIFLVIVVARLVSLWGQVRTPAAARRAGDAAIGSSVRDDGGRHADADADAPERPVEDKDTPDATRERQPHRA